MNVRAARVSPQMKGYDDYHDGNSFNRAKLPSLGATYVRSRMTFLMFVEMPYQARGYQCGQRSSFTHESLDRLINLFPNNCNREFFLSGFRHYIRHLRELDSHS